jgi:phage gp46-like protein
MSLDRKIDPVTLDYVDAVNGKFEEVDVLENQIVVSVMVALKAWEGDPELGSRLGEMERTTDTDVNRRRMRDLLNEALAWLVQDGSLASVDAEVAQYANGRVAFQVSAYRPGERDPVSLPNFLVSVGGSP